MKFGDSARKPFKAFMLALGLLLYAGTTLVKYAVGPEVIFSAIYILPIAFVTWYVSARAGLVLAFTSAVSLLVLDLEFRRFRNNAIPFWNASMDLVVFSFSALVLSKLKELLAIERQLSREDRLTGLGNRMALLEALDRERQRSLRYAHPFTLFYFDLDNFKTVNDTQGHSTGDHLLSLVAEVLRRNLRDIDSASRFGGDEFVVLLPETGALDARGVLVKLKEAMLALTNRYPITQSIGIVTFAAPLESAQEMISCADRAMYQAKKAGKNCFVHVLVACKDA